MRFGMLICQDITFVDVMAEYEALGIRDVIFSTHFANLRPVFKMGLHFQGFSMDRGINLIGACGRADMPTTTRNRAVHTARM